MVQLIETAPITAAEERAVHYLITNGPGYLDLFKPELVAQLLAAGRVRLDGDGRYAVTALGRYEVGRADTIPAGEVIAVFDPASREVTGSARGQDLFRLRLPEGGGWFRPWREQVAAVLGVFGWTVTGQWSQVGEPDESGQVRWGTVLRYERD
ncbi:hypothetical protein [Micromonospora sp. WMMC273]|uniref:hypothetical protein n=1 Tax=Micromonospora sp. WMMC273 TaxID=3015157 RepID=UPI0022B63FBB|nr:hypothetical protein [Micromonospora sp. WMMC273]MCZ7478866.1 hypothetical protein [Micromonospora sp. WMMC273]MCZ7478975.1 hypothetical protein [Micromonospora sp. WMMC273]